MANSGRRPALIFILVATFALGPVADACGPYGIGAAFWKLRQPGPELEAFLQGELGILDRHQDAAYLYVAYRHLAGLDMGLANQQALASIWEPSTSGTAIDAGQAWREARQRVEGLAAPGWISTSRSQATDADGTVTYAYFLNCLDNALLAAAETLTARIERFGVASREVQAWATAQDQVFANCSQGETIPQPLGEEWDPLIRADRAYQIAAAHFYATHYLEAAEHFRAIAQDSASPWRELAAYLVARALIRDGRYAEAESELRAIQGDPQAATMHPPARRLHAFCRLRSDPAGRRRELAEELLAAHLESPLQQSFIDFSWLLERPSGDDELGAWLRAAKHGGGEIPGSGTGLPGWVAALLTATAETPHLDALLAWAATVPADSPAHLTVAFHHARLLVASGRAAEARAVIDPLFIAPEKLSASDRNRLRWLRAEVTPELDDYLRIAAMQPVRLGWDDGSGHLLLNLGDPGSTFPDYRLSQPMLPDTAVELLNHGLKVEEMLRLSTDDVLGDPWRRRLALATWTRAVLVGEHDLALQAADVVATCEPELAGEMTAFTEAEAGERGFTAAWTMLRFPGLTPVVRWNVGRQTRISERDALRDNGWCAGVLEADEVPGQSVRDADQIAAVQASLPTGGLPAAPHYLGRIVLARVESHPDDPRLPEALHRVVEATRYGCPVGGYGEVSRAAFQVLHRRFPANPWTQQTPYWFD